VPADSPVILLVKEPVPVPLEVFVESETVGSDVVPHTTPLAVIGEPPSALMFPPLVAVEEVIDGAVTVAEMVGEVAANV
jgi:hypothetical protein